MSRHPIAQLHLRSIVITTACGQSNLGLNCSATEVHNLSCTVEATADTVDCRQYIQLSSITMVEGKHAQLDAYQEGNLKLTW